MFFGVSTPGIGLEDEEHYSHNVGLLLPTLSSTPLMLASYLSDVDRKSKIG